MKKDWTYKKLGEVAEIVGGSTPKTSEPANWEGSNMWVTPAELGGSKYFGKTQRTISDKAASKLQLLPIGTVLFSSRAPIGKVAITTAPMYCNQGFKNVICGDNLYNEYVYWCLTYNIPLLQSLGVGATFKELSKSAMSNFSIPIPPLSIQRSIVAELDLLHSVIEKKQEQLRALDNLAQSLFYQMFGDPITNPMGWQVKKLGEVAETYRGLTYSKKDETNVSSKKVLRSNNIDLLTHSLDLEDIKYLRDDFIIPEDKKIKKDSIFICMSNGSMQHLGKVAYIDKDYDYAFGGFMGLIVPRKSVSARFVYYNLLLPAFLQTVLKEGRGANINNLKFSDIENFPIILPPLSLQQSFAAKVSAIEAQKQAITQSIKDVESLLAQRMDNYFG